MLNTNPKGMQDSPDASPPSRQTDGGEELHVHVSLA